MNLEIVFICFSCFFIVCKCGCPDNYNSYKNQVCFRVINSKIRYILYSHAIRNCVDMNGKLASFDDKEQEDWIVNNFLNDPSQRYTLWIGLQRNETPNDTWFWADRNPSTYRNWHNGEPNNQGDGRPEHCVHIDFRSVNGTRRVGWNDLPCAQRHIHGYICRAPFTITMGPLQTTTPHREIITIYDYNSDDLDFVDTDSASVPTTRKQRTELKDTASIVDEPNYGAIIGVTLFVGVVLLVALALFIRQWRNRNLYNYSVRMNNMRK